MIIDFNELDEKTIPKMNNGNGEVKAQMDVNECGRFVLTTLPPKSSIGYHKQETNDDINYIIEGEGEAICDDVKETLKPGVVHICPKNSSHSIINTGEKDLIFFTIVPINNIFV